MRGREKRFVVDDKGERVAAIVDIAEYEALLAAQEELDSIRAYDEAKASGDEAVPFERAVAEIERGRR